MPTAKPRISTVVERPIFEAVKKLAARDQVSISDRARTLLLEALELEEDMALDALVAARMKKPGRIYSHTEAGRLLGLK